MKKNMKKIMALLLTVTLSLGLYGCGSKNDKTESGTSTAAGSDISAAATDGSEKKTLVIGDTTFNSSNEELDVNPHNSYSGWACIRYGIGETLVKYSDDMELEPWLAKEWENTDPLTWKITLQDHVTFSSGRAMDAEAVKQCLEHLLANHDRAAADTKIDSMEADGQVLTIHTSEPKPALLNYLGDPYGCIIDVDAGFDPLYASVSDKANAGFLGKGISVNKYTGARGKSGASDANAEYVAWIRNILEKNDICYQIAELGKVDIGGGGTIAYIIANKGADVIDCGVPVLSMHAPYEVTSKFDIYSAYKTYKAFWNE